MMGFAHTISGPAQVLFIAAYVAYLCRALIGGLKPSPLAVRKLVPMPAVALGAVAVLFDGVSTTADAVDIGFVCLLAVAKGVFLGRRKIVEQADGAWFVRHDGTYIAWWLGFFAAKMVVAGAILAATGVAVAPWHALLYFFLFFTVRSIVIARRHPEAFRKEDASVAL